MKAKLFLLLSIVITGFRVSAQTKEKSLPLIISIDGDIPSAGIYKGTFLIEDILGNPIDTIPFNYVVSKATVTAKQYRELMSLAPKDKVVLRFGYDRSYPNVNVPEEYYEYETKMSARYFNDEYIIVKIYNFANPLNKIYAPSKKGYGVELYTPNGVTLIPLKKPALYRPLKKWTY
jgi:hypothetical protein